MTGYWRIADPEAELARWMEQTLPEIVTSGEDPEAVRADFAEMIDWLHRNPLVRYPDGSIEAEPFLRWAAERWDLSFEETLALAAPFTQVTEVPD